MKNVEVYSKEWCPYCAKAKSLLQSKGIEYIEIDITNDEQQEAKMIERSQRRTVPQIFIDSESLGGYDDLAQLNATGELDQRLDLDRKQVRHQVYDVAVLGAGPAGMTAAIYAARKNLKTIIIAYDVGGQVGTTYEIANYPGFQMITGPDLVKQFIIHVEDYGIEQLIGEKVTKIDIQDRCKMILTASGREVCAKAVIVATGAFKRKLNIPGEKDLAGKGVVYCTTCDGPLFKDMEIAIIGGGNSGLEAAIEMNLIAKKVYLISSADWTGDQILQDKVASAKSVIALKHHRPKEIFGSSAVEKLAVVDTKSDETKELDVQGVFIEIGLFPNSDFMIDMVETTERGQIKVDHKGYTGVRGIFAAGDVTNNDENQIIVSAGEGARAALSAFNYLITQV
jgi:alkyl hydroperoxide reductase subunit F